MSKINLKGLTKENFVTLGLTILALINAGLRICGFDTLPISNDDIANSFSIIFLIATTIWGIYKNFNTTPASQIGQKITDAIKNGEILIDQVEEMLDKLKNEYSIDK